MRNEYFDIPYLHEVYDDAGKLVRIMPKTIHGEANERPSQVTAQQTIELIQHFVICGLLPKCPSFLEIVDTKINAKNFSFWLFEPTYRQKIVKISFDVADIQNRLNNRIKELVVPGKERVPVFRLV